MTYANLVFTKRLTLAYPVHKRQKIVNLVMMHLNANHVNKVSISKIHRALIAQNSLNNVSAAIKISASSAKKAFIYPTIPATLVVIIHKIVSNAMILAVSLPSKKFRKNLHQQQSRQ